MRTILFRGKRVDTGKWVYGSFICSRMILDYDLGFVEVIPETVGQFTGLYDMYERAIFEGDIIDTPRWYVSYVGELGSSYGMDAGWYIQRDNFESWSNLECVDNYKILGNIHDNPELLERQNG